jgi:hypothetical protein
MGPSGRIEALDAGVDVLYMISFLLAGTNDDEL